eukprot:1181926-Prorocentrum_minimum.AAC.1
MDKQIEFSSGKVARQGLNGQFYSVLSSMQPVEFRCEPQNTRAADRKHREFDAVGPISMRASLYRIGGRILNSPVVEWLNKGLIAMLSPTNLLVVGLAFAQAIHQHLREVVREILPVELGD